MLCPACGKLISSDEAQCPYCGVPKPGSKPKKILSRLLSPRPQQVIPYIIYTNVFIYFVSLLLSSTNVVTSVNPLNFLSPSSRSMLLLGATGTIPINEIGRWWTLISANYLHGGLLHIFFNMMALRQLGPIIVGEYGAYRMIAIYTLSGILGYVVSYFAGVSFTIGASAAVSGLIGAALYYGKSRGGVYGQALFKDVSGWIVGLALFGFVVPGINNWGHGGGIAGGLILGYLLGYNERKRETICHSLLSAGCILMTTLTLLWAILTSVYYSFLI